MAPRYGCGLCFFGAGLCRFLSGEIKFTDIPKINESVLEQHPWNDNPSLADLTQLDDWVKEFVTNY